MEGEFEQLAGYEGLYEIAKSYPHQIRKVSDGRILSETDNGIGYLMVTLAKERISTRHYKHILIASQFVPNPNPNQYNQVDHINHIRTDNRIENLRWVTSQDNNRNRSSYNGVAVQFFDYNEIRGDVLIEVKKYGEHSFEFYYYDVTKNKFFYDTGVNYRELHTNFRRNAAFVYARDTNNKQTCIYYNKFKRL